MSSHGQCEENLEKTMLEKRFSPSWLAGTSVGELMFQADYYLKELAVGEPLGFLLWMARCRAVCWCCGHPRG